MRLRESARVGSTRRPHTRVVEGWDGGGLAEREKNEVAQTKREAGAPGLGGRGRSTRARVTTRSAGLDDRRWGRRRGRMKRRCQRQKNRGDEKTGSRKGRGMKPPTDI